MIKSIASLQNILKEASDAVLLLKALSFLLHICVTTY